jgi:hypothetical protein
LLLITIFSSSVMAYENAPQKKCYKFKQVIAGVPGVGNNCCEGLRATARKNQYTQNCEYKWDGLAGSGGTCIKCGDGVCDKNLESKCNCPEDCGI